MQGRFDALCQRIEAGMLVRAGMTDDETMRTTQLFVSLADHFT